MLVLVCSLLEPARAQIQCHTVAHPFTGETSVLLGVCRALLDR